MSAAPARTDHVEHAHRDVFLTPHPLGAVMSDLTCDRSGCFEPVLLTRAPRDGVPPKRFCSSRCQLAAQKSRWKARRRAAATMEKNDG
jgi:hypothetical protein